MISWIILAVYLIGWAGFSVTIARFLMKNDEFFVPDNAVDAVMLILTSMFAAAFWPLVIPGGWVYKKVFAKNEEDK